MINSLNLLIVKTCLKFVYFNSTFSKHIIKAACKISEQYKIYDYFKKAYKHDAEHDVAKMSHFLGFFSVRILNY